MSEQSKKPTRKVMAGATIGAPLGMVVVWLINVLVPEVEVPQEVAAAIGSLFSVAASYVVPDKP